MKHFAEMSHIPHLKKAENAHLTVSYSRRAQGSQTPTTYLTLEPWQVRQSDAFFFHFQF